MPFRTGAELEIWKDGFAAGWKSRRRADERSREEGRPGSIKGNVRTGPKKKRQLSAWNKFVKANSKKPRFIYRNGKLNLKKMGVAFRKTPAGKKKK